MAFLHKGKNIKTVSFFGFGKSNKAIFEYLKKHYPDLKFTVRIMGEAHGLPRCAKVFKNEKVFEDFYEDAVFVSPSVRRDKPEFKAKLLSSDAELFFEKNVHDVFAVTGSDGKSTTTYLAKELLSAAFKKTFAIGNIGTPFVSALDYEDSCAFAAELSSFQLMDFEPPARRAVITNISPNHLDWHSSFEEYTEAKENVLKRAEEPVFFLDRETKRDWLNKYPPYAIASAKLGEDEIKVYKAQTYVYIKNGAIYENGKEIIPLSLLRRKEEYNINNFLSALALTHGFWDRSTVLTLAQTFTGLKHRLELILDFSGVEFYDSSIDSSPQRTFATLSAFNRTCVLIMGGRTKMKNYKILRDLIAEKAHALVLTGENRFEIYKSLTPLPIPVYIEENFASAIKLGFISAKEKCPLVFSPASVSYDAFKNFEERGDAFKYVAKEIKEQGL